MGEVKESHVALVRVFGLVDTKGFVTKLIAPVAAILKGATPLPLRWNQLVPAIFSFHRVVNEQASCPTQLRPTPRHPSIHASDR